MRDILKVWWCVLFHKKSYSASPSMDEGGKKCVYCKKCKTHFWMNPKTFDRLDIKDD